MSLWAGEQVADGTDPLTLIAALGAVLAAVVAAGAVFFEGRRVRRQLGIENMWRLVDKWDSPEFRARRAEAASFLLKMFPRRPTDTKEVPYALSDLLDMFEVLGYLVVRSKTLPMEDAWINFSAPGVLWWHVCEPIVETYQHDDPTMYEDYSELAEKFMEEDSKRLKASRQDLRPSNDQLRSFLRGEAGLVEAIPPWRAWLVKVARRRATP